MCALVGGEGMAEELRDRLLERFEVVYSGYGATDLEIVSDSELLVKQMRGEYKVKNEALRRLSLEATRLARDLGSVTYTAVRREHNELADRLVNDVLDQEAKRL